MTPNLGVARRFAAARGTPHGLILGVTGAHYYGFPSEDSDLDLKGIHVAPTREVVGLRPPPETVDLTTGFEGVEVDYTSHELAFALRLLLKGNGNILERVLSPYQVLDSDAAAALRDLARAAVSRRFYHHYRGFFGRTCREWRGAPARTAKGLLYAYRSALTGIHLLRTGECVGDVVPLAETYGFGRVAGLVALKRSRERGEVSASPDDEADLERLEALLEAAHGQSPLPEEAPNSHALDAFLVQIRREAFD
jgi:hypothetical protein